MVAKKRVLFVCTGNSARSQIAEGLLRHISKREDSGPSTTRMTRELVTFMRGDADSRGLDLTAYVNKMLDGVRTWFGLPHREGRGVPV